MAGNYCYGRPHRRTATYAQTPRMSGLQYIDYTIWDQSAPFSSTGGRPIHANGQEAVGTQRAAGSEQETSPPAQQVETTGQRNLDAFLDRNWKGEEFQRGLLNKPQEWSLEDLETLAAEAKRNLNPNLRKTGLVLHCPSSDGESDGESAEANYVDPENELLYGRDEKGEASYGRTHDSRRSDLDDDYSALSASAGGQSKGVGPKVLFPSLCSPCSNCAA